MGLARATGTQFWNSGRAGRGGAGHGTAVSSSPPAADDSSTSSCTEMAGKCGPGKMSAAGAPARPAPAALSPPRPPATSALHRSAAQGPVAAGKRRIRPGARAAATAAVAAQRWHRVLHAGLLPWIAGGSCEPGCRRTWCMATSASRSGHSSAAKSRFCGARGQQHRIRLRQRRADGTGGDARFLQEEGGLVQSYSEEGAKRPACMEAQALRGQHGCTCDSVSSSRLRCIGPRT